MVPRPVTVAGVLGQIKAHPHVALRGQVVHLFRLDTVNHVHQITRIRYISIVKMQIYAIRIMRIFIDMLDAMRVECTGAP